MDNMYSKKERLIPYFKEWLGLMKVIHVVLDDPQA